MSTPETTPAIDPTPEAPITPPSAVPDAPTNNSAPVPPIKDGKGGKGEKKDKRQAQPKPPKENEPPKQAAKTTGGDMGVEVEMEVDEEWEEPLPVERSAAERVVTAGEKMEPIPPPTRPTCPPVGTKLFCETVEGDTSVICEVESVVEEDGVFVVQMPGLANRRWPFSVERLVGKRLVFVPEDYPAIGTDTHFDSRFRQHLKGIDLTARERDLLAKSRFVPPRKARVGYTWVKVLSGPVSMAGFTYEGKAVKGEHPLSKDEKALYVEVLISTAKPLFPEKILLDCGVG